MKTTPRDQHPLRFALRLSIINHSGTPYGDYNVLATDYDNYGLVYSCKETLGGLASLHYAWVLTRSKAISSDDMNKYLDMFKKNGVDISYFEDTTQDCSDNH